MKNLCFCVLLALAVAVQVSAANADVVLTVGSNDAMDLDFDGVGFQTDGDLGVTSHMFTLTGIDIPNIPEFANITSINIAFLSSGGNLSAHNGVNFGGIGVASLGEGAVAARTLNPGTPEILTVNVSSTSSVPSQQVLLSGMGFAGWHETFPVSQAEFTGATVNGLPYYLGGSGSNVAMFDLPGSGVSVWSATGHATGGGDPFRLHEIHLTVSSVPEPSVILPGIFALVGCLVKRPNRRSSIIRN